MAKGLFGSLKGVDAFGKVCHVATLRNDMLMTTQTTEDVKVKTRTGAFCKIVSVTELCCYLCLT